jgi:hypothetical protein
MNLTIGDGMLKLVSTVDQTEAAEGFDDDEMQEIVFLIEQLNNNDDLTAKLSH